MGISKLFTGILQGVVSGSEKGDNFFKRYISTVLLIFAFLIFILVSKYHSQSLYRDIRESNTELRSVEAEYSKLHAIFMKATLKSEIIDEVERRGLKLEKNNNSTIVID